MHVDIRSDSDHLDEYEDDEDGVQVKCHCCGVEHQSGNVYSGIFTADGVDGRGFLLFRTDRLIWQLITRSNSCDYLCPS